MKVIRNKLIPFKGYKAMTVWPFVFVRKDQEYNEVDANHETIHGAQQVECHIVIGLILLIMACVGIFRLWWILCTPLFYFLFYVLEYMIRCLAYGDNEEGYRNISFEQEAYNMENTLPYMSFRTPFEWVKYLGKKTYNRYGPKK